MNRDELHWESYDGRKIVIKDLEVRHLVNIINHIKKTNEEAGRQVYSNGLYLLMLAEAEIRIMVGWAANIGIPNQLENGYWELINQTANEKAIEDAQTAMHQQAMEAQKKENARLTRQELIAKQYNNQQLKTPEKCI